MPTNDETQDRPATVRDVTTAITTAIAASEQRTSAAIGAAIGAAIAASEQRTVDRLTEVMRDMQTEILTGLQAFARGNFTRFKTLEARVQTTDSNVLDNNARIAALEERVLYLETRRPTH
jgi:hypothetical protein